MTHYEIKSPRKRGDKTFWLKVGVLMQGDGDQYTIYLDALPLPDADGRCVLKCYPPRERQEEKKTYEQKEEIPF